MGVHFTARRLAVTLAATAFGVGVTILAPAAAGAQDGPTAPCNDRADACIDLVNNLSWLMQGGDVTYGPVPISHGKPGYETPAGTFHVTFKNKDHISSIYNAPMPNAVFFNGGIAFHAGSLNSRSAGCVRMLLEDSEVYFNTLQPSDTVQVVRGLPAG